MPPSALERLNQFAHGYQHASVLLGANKAGVFAAMGEDARPVSEIAQKAGLDERSLEVVLLALTAMDIVTQEPGGFRIRDEYAPYLLPDSPTTHASMFNHGHNIMQNWVRLEETLRAGRPIRREIDRDEQSVRDFICGMSNISRTSSMEVAEKMDLSGFRRMLDVGGGPATSSIVFAQRNPHLHAVVFDLEGPIAIAREEVEKSGLGDRVRTQVGDFLVDELGDGFDLVYVSNIIHSLSPGQTRLLFGKCFGAAEPGGTVVVKDFFLEPDRVTPAYAALFSINMLVNTERGKSYTYDETEAILREVGFEDFQRIPVATASALILARKPA